MVAHYKGLTRGLYRGYAVVWRDGLDTRLGRFDSVYLHQLGDVR